MDMFKDKFVKRVLFLIALAVLVWFLWAVRSIFLYVAIASVFSLMASPAVDLLDRVRIGGVRIPNTVSVILVMTFFFLLFAGVFSMLIPLVATQAENLSLLDAEKAKENALQIYHNVVGVLMDYGIIGATPELTTDYIRSIDFSFRRISLNRWSVDRFPVHVAIRGDVLYFFLF